MAAINLCMQIAIVVITILVILFILFRIFKTLLKWFIIAIIAILTIGYFTNPKEADHRQSLKERAKELSLRIRERTVSIDDYKVFSVTKVKVKGEERITGIGFMGKVWHFGDLREKLSKSKHDDDAE